MTFYGMVGQNPGTKS